MPLPLQPEHIPAGQSSFPSCKARKDLPRIRSEGWVRSITTHVATELWAQERTGCAWSSSSLIINQKGPQMRPKDTGMPLWPDQVGTTLYDTCQIWSGEEIVLGYKRTLRQQWWTVKRNTQFWSVNHGISNKGWGFPQKVGSGLFVGERPCARNVSSAGAKKVQGRFILGHKEPFQHPWFFVFRTGKEGKVGDKVPQNS